MTHFPFGQPVEPRKPSATNARRVFLLGPYPSALHIQWLAPKGFEGIKALAVDNEPVPFWTGTDEAARIARWTEQVGWKAEWGSVQPAGAFNGSSGLRVEQEVLSPLHTSRAETWVTDCLDTYRFSRGQQDAVTDRYAPFAAKLGLPWAGVPPGLQHPNEDDIVREAAEHHHKRLMGELRTAAPQVVVTLGNAALRVFARLASVPEPKLLTPDKDYGKEIGVTFGSKHVAWIALVHPGQRSKEWKAAHGRWMHLRSKPA